ncbi:F510_1955 family glycosylhydrolase [Exiguobacterium flavidum]|uniref:F510_1955 family glycosylhydrolase n=1 Tax=Exiguobacterium flavidum TaxID=2184695 RepID=UPI000DF73D84|nr:hypothetical protein [Exiguobacterium flavidum]
MDEGTSVSHIHGAGFWQEDGRPVIATHTGLMEYRKDGWYELTSNRHDYMGFELVEDGFFASGHPQPDSPYENPLGVVRGTDKGTKLEIRSLEGEADFHYMSAGHTSMSLYVFLGEATKGLSPGFYRSLDQGKTFEPMNLTGADPQGISGMLADPSHPMRVYLFGPAGILVSKDGGDSFEPLFERENILAADADEGHLVYVSKSGASYELTSYLLGNGARERIDVPELSKGALPVKVVVQDERLLLVASNNSVYQFEGGAWTALLDQGE